MVSPFIAAIAAGPQLKPHSSPARSASASVKRGATNRLSSTGVISWPITNSGARCRSRVWQLAPDRSAGDTIKECVPSTSSSDRWFEQRNIPTAHSSLPMMCTAVHSLVAHFIDDDDLPIWKGYFCIPLLNQVRVVGQVRSGNRPEHHRHSSSFPTCASFHFCLMFYLNDSSRFTSCLH